jgi:hypothetical protein
LNPFFQPTSALPSISQATSLASRALGIDPKSPNPSSSNAAPAETAEGPGSAGSAPAPPAPGLPPHANRDPLKTTTAEGAAVKPNSIPRGAPSEMSHVPSPTSSRPPPVSTASSTGLGVSGGASRPGFTTQKSGFGVGPGGRLPLNTLPHPPPSAVMANYTPSQPASPASASSGGGAGSFPLGGPNANATNASGSLGRSTSRSSSRRRSQSSQANSGGKEQAHPFHLSHNPQGNIGLQNALQAIKGETKDLCWVGALGNRTDGVGKATRSDIESRLWKEQKSKAVWIEDKVFEGHCTLSFFSPPPLSSLFDRRLRADLPARNPLHPRRRLLQADPLANLPLLDRSKGRDDQLGGLRQGQPGVCGQARRDCAFPPFLSLASMHHLSFLLTLLSTGVLYSTRRETSSLSTTTISSSSRPWFEISARTRSSA